MAEIVYIDDEKPLLRCVAQLIEGIGHSVTTFSDPLAALAYIESHEVAVVLCDYRMPDMNGLEVRKRLPREIPFFIVSGNLSDLDPRLAAGYRISGQLAKPFRPEDLFALIDRGIAEGQR